jgi:hypothetical protein
MKEKYSADTSLQERRLEKYIIVGRRIEDTYMVVSSDHAQCKVDRKGYVIVC